MSYLASAGSPTIDSLEDVLLASVDLFLGRIDPHDLLADMERKVLRILLGVPCHGVEVEIGHITVLEVLYLSASKEGRDVPVRPTRLYATIGSSPHVLMK
jgi:hypothetical protein